MDIFVGSLKGRALWFFELLSTAIMFIMTVILVIGSYQHFLRAWTNGDSSFDIELPTWPAKLIVPVALTILAIRLLLQIWGYIRALKENNDTPVAVPLIEDVATQAANEAKTVSGAGDDVEETDLSGDK